MSTILVTCEECGNLELDETTVWLEWDNNEASFRFTCPECGQTGGNSCDEQTTYLLRRAGVKERRVGDWTQEELDTWLETLWTVEDLGRLAEEDKP